MRYRDCIDELIKLHKEAHKQVILACKNEGLIVPNYDGKTGNGIFSRSSKDTWNS